MKTLGKKLVYGLTLTVGIGVGLSACSDFLDQGENMYPSAAEVSFYHASPNVPQLSVTVENKNFLTEPLGYTQYTGYKSFYTGNRQFAFKNPTNTSTLLDTTLTFTANNSYSVFVINNDERIETLVTIDTSDVPHAGKAMVRFIQLSPDINPVDVAVVGDNEDTFSDISFKEGSPFIEVPARTFKVMLKNAATDDELLTSGDITLTAGNYYTIISRGFNNPPDGNSNTLSVQVVEND